MTVLLNKVKYGGVAAVIIMVIRWFIPDATIPEGLEDAIMLVIIFASQFFIKENERTVSQLKYRKGGKGAAAWRGSAMLLLVFLMSAGTMRAQTFEHKIALGGGSLFSEEEITFDRDSLFAAVHWSGIELPLNAGSGLGIEFQFPALSSSQVVYSLWSLNRIDVSDGFYSGADMRISKETDGDFDLRLVIGARLFIPGSGEMSVEFYTLEDERPIAFAVLYQF